jgi:hypothetical protein
VTASTKEEDMFKRLARSRPRELPPAPEPSRVEDKKPQPEARPAEESAPQRKRHWMIRDLAGFEFPYDEP